jgi:spore coat polysaccharide biosynthesis protein SpsF (cytidylyltransferase family)
MREVAGVPVLVHLLRQLIHLDIPIVLAVPNDQRGIYDDCLYDHNDLDAVELVSSSHDEDPLARTAEMQRMFGFSHVIRITHDKIFVDTENLQNALDEVEMHGHDYLFSSTFIPGTGFEIIEATTLQKTAAKYKNVEHISYAVRLVAEKQCDMPSNRPKVNFNLLIDFPEDLEMMEVIFSQVFDPTLPDVLKYLSPRHDLHDINRPPMVSVYICAYNAEKFLDRAIKSVLDQDLFGELIIVDDCSSDTTPEIAARWKASKKGAPIKWLRNKQNLGLAASSNVALKNARGKFIVRLDADDYFTYPEAIADMVAHSIEHKVEALYPDNYLGHFSVIQKGKEKHHAGGTLFDTRALNFLKFNAELRNYEGLDLFVRAKEALKIGYFENPVFFYTQRPDSMSQTNLVERARVKEEIEKRAQA